MTTTEHFSAGAKWANSGPTPGDNWVYCGRFAGGSKVGALWVQLVLLLGALWVVFGRIAGASWVISGRTLGKNWVNSGSLLGETVL